MKEWSEKSLAAEGYKLMNAEITCVSLNFRDHGVLTLDLSLSGGGWGCVYGGYVLGKGYLGAREFKGSASGLEAIMRIMDIVGVEDLINLKGKHVTVKAILLVGNLHTELAPKVSLTKKKLKRSRLLQIKVSRCTTLQLADNQPVSK